MVEKFPGSTEEQPRSPSRRRFLAGAVVAGGALVAGALIGKNLLESGERDLEQSFEKKILGYRELYGRLRRNEILFVGDDGAPLEKVTLEPYKGISPGSFDKGGFLQGRLSQKWLDSQRERVCASRKDVTCDLAKGLPRQLNSIQPIKEVVLETPDEKLDPKTFFDIVMHYGQKKVIDGGGLNRIEYVRQHVTESIKLPPIIEQELKFFLPGLAAQESRFNNAAESTVGAEGIFQFMPDTWKELGYSRGDMSRLTKQVSAVDMYFARAYGQITRGVGYALERIKKEYFKDDEAAYLKYFLTPVLVNSYNAGSKRMEAVVTWFAEHLDQVPEGVGGNSYDVFYLMTQMAQRKDAGRLLQAYGTDAAEYVPRAYALAQLIEG